MMACFKIVLLIICLVLQHLPFLQTLIIISHNCMNLSGPSNRISRCICRRTTKHSKITFGVQFDGCRMIPIECCWYASKLYLMLVDCIWMFFLMPLLVSQSRMVRDRMSMLFTTLSKNELHNLSMDQSSSKIYQKM